MKCIFIKKDEHEEIKIKCEIIKHVKNKSIILKPLTVLYSNNKHVDLNTFEIDLKLFAIYENYYIKFGIIEDIKILFDENLNPKVFIL